jgi:hypothetical protein
MVAMTSITDTARVRRQAAFSPDAVFIATCPFALHEARKKTYDATWRPFIPSARTGNPDLSAGPRIIRRSQVSAGTQI